MSYYIENIPDDKDVITEFKDLVSLAHVFMEEKDLPEGVSADKVLRYLIYMYDPNTPLRTEIPDIKKRKQFVLKKLNLLTEGDTEVPEGYSQMCMMNQEWIVKRFVAFTKFFKSIAYEKLLVAEERYAQMNHLILTSVIDKATDDKNLQTGRKAWYEDMKEALAEIMHGETSKKLEEEIVFTVKIANLGLRPEEYTREYKETKTVFPDIIP